MEGKTVVLTGAVVALLIFLLTKKVEAAPEQPGAVVILNWNGET